MLTSSNENEGAAPKSQHLKWWSNWHVFSNLCSKEKCCLLPTNISNYFFPLLKKYFWMIIRPLRALFILPIILASLWQKENEHFCNNKTGRFKFWESHREKSLKPKSRGLYQFFHIYYQLCVIGPNFEPYYAIGEGKFREHFCQNENKLAFLRWITMFAQ